MTDAAVTITPTENGPYLVKGPVTMLDADGSEYRIDRSTIALCRCGGSTNDRAHRNSPGVLIEVPYLWGGFKVVGCGCRWWCGGVCRCGRGGRGGGSCRRRG